VRAEDVTDWRNCSRLPHHPNPPAGLTDGIRFQNGAHALYSPSQAGALEALAALIVLVLADRPADWIPLGALIGRGTAMGAGLRRVRALGSVPVAA